MKDNNKLLIESIPIAKGGNLMTQSQAVLVVLPTLGQRIKTFRETLESIKVEQSLVSLRLVVVVPPEAHEARKVAKEFGATLVDDPGLGISHAINLGVAQSQSEDYYAWMGDDDLFRRGGLKSLLDLFSKSPRAVVAYGACEYIDEKGDLISINSAGKLATFLLPWGPDLIPHPGSMIRLDALKEAGPFDVSLKYAMDLDMFLRLKKCGEFVSTKRVVSAFRWHPDSLTVASRNASGKEAEKVKYSHLPILVRPFNFLWKYPVRWASNFAARFVTFKSKRI